MESNVLSSVHKVRAWQQLELKSADKIHGVERHHHLREGRRAVVPFNSITILYMPYCTTV